ncbi:MAG: ABC transporter permease subunit [Fuerstiella sp.]|nr:ABC transporter permease subunit [Fuerstiella sp.]MCP4854930.1 ABC transporter permease subunit [Fuerstiella sp.]
MKKTLIILLLMVAAFAPRPTHRSAVRVSSKKFTESVILGEMFRILSEDSGHSTQHLRELGGTRIVFESLTNGEVDIYAEYTGTLVNELFSDRDIRSIEELRAALGELGIRMSEPLGFNNTYALGMLNDRAHHDRIHRISDLNRVAGLRFGFGSEFVEREDGWGGLKSAYGLTPESVTGLDHDIAYRQLQLGLIDVTDVYTTDARIDALGLTVLEDDRAYFPRYDAVILYREETADRFRDVIDSVLKLEGRLSEVTMTSCNRRVEIDGETEQRVAADFVRAELGVDSVVAEPSRFERIANSTFDHLELVRRSLLPAILIAVPLGIFASRNVWFGYVALAVTGLFQTIPSFALLVMLLPIAAMLGMQSVGAGSATAIIALFLYSLLPIVRNTHTGLTSIDSSLLESAEVLNLPTWYRLLEIELPLASRAILSGIKTAAVLNIGFATLGALVGAGGYGQPILSGIRLADTALILEGAIPAAVLALVVQAGFEVVERFAVPRGLRMKPTNA